MTTVVNTPSEEGLKKKKNIFIFGQYKGYLGGCRLSDKESRHESQRSIPIRCIENVYLREIINACFVF